MSVDVNDDSNLSEEYDLFRHQPAEVEATLTGQKRPLSAAQVAALQRARRGRRSQEVMLAIQARQRVLMSRDPKVRELRQRMDMRTTDKYYRSEEVSVFGTQTASDTTLKPGQRPAPPLYRPVPALDERNTDRYYRDRLVRGPTRQQIARAPMTARRPGRPVATGSQTRPVEHQQAIRPFLVPNEAGVRPAVEAAVQAVLSGHQRVVLAVTGPPLLGLKVRTLLDSMVTRAALTEDQGRDVIIDMSRAGSYRPETRTPDEIFGAPEPAPARPAAGAVHEDPADFLAGGHADDDEETIPEAAPPLPDDEDNDFLTPGQGDVDVRKQPPRS